METKVFKNAALARAAVRGSFPSFRFVAETPEGKWVLTTREEVVDEILGGWGPIGQFLDVKAKVDAFCKGAEPGTVFVIPRSLCLPNYQS